MNGELIMKAAKQYEEQMIADRRKLHSCPGIGVDLDDTVAYVKAELTAMGYEPQDCGKAGVVALAGGKKPGKVFLLRADMDALPMAEESGEEFASDNGYMHACGHDLHTTMLLGAARILKEYEDEIEGTIKLMFQPAEEIFEGAHDMIMAGVLENPKVDAAMMMHVTAGMPFPAGTPLIMSPGVSASACDFFEIKIQGKGCHGSTPEQGVDPITVAAHMVLALQEINAREISMYDTAALTLGTLQAGNANNIIPDTALLKGSLRTVDEELRANVKTRIQEIATGIAKVYRAEAEVIFGSGCPSLLNDKDVSDSVAKYAKELFTPRGAFTTAELAAMSGGGAKGAGGSEDFAFVTREIPGLMLAIAAGQPQAGYTFPGHHPKVRFDEATLVKGAGLFAYAAMRWLEEHK